MLLQVQTARSGIGPRQRSLYIIKNKLGISVCWKLDRECHVDFLYVSYPPRIELWTLDENSRKENEKECVKAVLYIVILEYSLYSKLSCCIRFIQRWSQN